MYGINLARFHHSIDPITLTSTERLAVLFCDMCLFAFLSCWLGSPRSEPESYLFLYLAEKKCLLGQKLPGIKLLLHHICSLTIEGLLAWNSEGQVCCHSSTGTPR